MNREFPHFSKLKNTISKPKYSYIIYIMYIKYSCDKYFYNKKNLIKENWS